MFPDVGEPAALYAGIKAAAMSTVRMMRTKVFVLFSFLNIAVLSFLAIFPINLPVSPAESRRMTRLTTAYGKNSIMMGAKDVGAVEVDVVPDTGRNDDEPRKVDRTAAILPMRGSAIMADMVVPGGTGETEKGEVPVVFAGERKFPEISPIAERIANSAEEAKPQRDM